MNSHHYDFAAPDVIQLILSVLAPVALFAGAMHLGAALNLLPSPRPILDMDRTILCHQAEVSWSRKFAELVLIGDSSCLMDVSAPKLGALLPDPARVLNLGTLSYLDLNTFASILRRYAANGSNELRTVVLLMHPEALRRASAEEHHLEVLTHYYDGKDYCERSSSPGICWMGGAIFKGRILGRFLPIPLNGVYAQKYGFTADLWNHLSAHAGSAVDPRKFDRATAQGNAEYQLSPRLQAASQAFRAAVPKGVRLAVGITPAPESFVGPSFSQRHAEMLRTWGAWLQADTILSDLPAALPDDLFASTTHLTEKGQEAYTELLARSLLPRLRQP